ncbi:hypothetical protein [Palleronia sediminis]|nr:hypothetical protein [Palleronia sediminis]
MTATLCACRDADLPESLAEQVIAAIQRAPILGQAGGSSEA